jgi:hypothetical protein
MARVTYLRVSTGEQSVEAQRTALGASDKEFRDQGRIKNPGRYDRDGPHTGMEGKFQATRAIQSACGLRNTLRGINCVVRKQQRIIPTYLPPCPLSIKPFGRVPKL